MQYTVKHFSETSAKEKILGLLSTLTDGEIKQLIFEVLTEQGYNLIVTPKEVDFMIEKLSEVLSEGINHTLHPNVTMM